MKDVLRPFAAGETVVMHGATWIHPCSDCPRASSEAALPALLATSVPNVPMPVALGPTLGFVE